MPKVSVIMGVYNGAKKIRNAVESIVNQSFSDFELIICDDGSTDDSIKILEELKDSRIIILKNEKNMKLAYTLNNCLNIAKGEYIARMDDDDICYLDRFQKQVEFLDSHPEYAIVGGGRNLYDDNGVWGKQDVYGERLKEDIFKGKSFIHPSVMMRREALLNVGGYTESPETARTEDYDLWCKLYQKGYKGYNLNDILINYYEARDSYAKRKYEHRIHEYKLKKKWCKQLNLPVKYAIYAYRPLIVGLIPIKVIMMCHSKRFLSNLKNKNKN